MIQAIRGNSTYDTKNGLSVDYPLRYHGEHIKTINCKIHLGVETEVSIFMTGGNKGGNPSSCCMSTKNDQEIIVSRKYEYKLEMLVPRLNISEWKQGWLLKVLLYDNKMHTRRCIA